MAFSSLKCVTGDDNSNLFETMGVYGRRESMKMCIDGGASWFEPSLIRSHFYGTIISM